MKKQKRPSNRWRLAAALITLACLSAIAYLLVISSNSDSTNEYKAVSTKFYKTEVPESYRVQLATNPENPNMISLLAYDSQKDRIEIGITTNLLPDGNLLGVPDYNLRVNKPAEYLSVNDPTLPTGSKLFRKKNAQRPEYVLYMVRGDRFASVMVTGDVSLTQLENLLRHVQTKWQWLPPESTE